MNAAQDSAAAPGSPAEIARLLVERLTAHDLDGMAELQHDDVVEDFIPVGAFRGKPAVREYFAELLAAFPDFHMEIERLSGDDRSATLQWRVSGTFTGSSFQGVAANGKHIELRGVDCMEFEDGLLRNNTIYYDGAAFARAVGLLPAQRSGAERALFGAFNAVTAVRKQIGI